MQRADFTYQLPDDLIAQAPADRRGQSRLLHLDGQGAIHHREFGDLKALLRPGDLLVVNDTRVIPARAFGRKASGGRVEFLLERILDEHALLAHLRASRAPAVGGRILLDAKESLALEVVGRQGDLFELRADCPVLPWLNQYGHVPLPPYIRRADDASDRQRYQTVFAHSPGAVAAPTAGLHFDEQHLRQLQEAGVGLARITLHVGSGTFLPVRVDDLSRHRMHAEWCEVPEAVCRAIDNTRQAGNRVVAVGTTVARALESAAAGGSLEPFCGLTRLFIRPGYRFAAIDALITNFHLPESTLLMLVCAFAGKERVLAAYAEAVARRYRFFSYGDAMFVEGDSGALMSPKTGMDVG